ncbi:MAG: cytochrome c biogenesis protein CcdA [Dermatophilaceae bacterium]|nr:cytochrome c biogenesis protein CcdA [Dermatophilaceae bacterium]
MNADLGAGPVAVAAVIAVVAGFVSFASPCCLPLVPGFLGYVTGLSEESLESRSRGRLVLGALLFVLGFTVVFLVAAAAVSTAGLAFQEYRGLLLRVAGVIVIVMGVVFLGLGKSYAITPSWRPRAGLAGAPLLGASFAIGWSPCLGPTLAAIQVMAAPLSAQSGTIGRGLMLAGFYSLGLGLPFILMAALWEKASAMSAWLRAHRRGIRAFGGLMLVVVGGLMVSGLWESLVVWLQINLISTFRVAI